MKIMIYTVYDSKTQVYGQPNFLLNKGAALRAFQELANDKTTQIGKYPADFTFFEIGEWDDEKGTLTMHHTKQNLGTALDHQSRNEAGLLHHGSPVANQEGTI